MKKTLALLFLLHNICFGQGLQLLDISEEVVVEGVDSSAAAQDKAQIIILDKYVKKFGKDLIGDKKYDQNKLAIHQIVIKDSGKFAPVSKSQVVSSNQEKYTVLVTMKISVANLRQIFERSGYLSSDVESGVVLPFISVVDQVRTRTYKWWVPDNQSDDLIRVINREFTKYLGQSLKSSGFFVLDAEDWAFRESLPEHLKKDYFRKDDYQYLYNYFKFPLSMKGQIDVAPSLKSPQQTELKIKVEVILNTQGRVIAETSRSVELESGDIKNTFSKLIILKELSDDLSDQVNVALRKGLFDSSMLQIVLRGNLNYKNTELFRSTLQKSLSGLRYISEKSIESQLRVYEVDYSGKPDDLSKKIEVIKFPGLRVFVQSVSDQKVEIRLDSET